MNVINPEIKILINKANSTRSVILPNGHKKAPFYLQEECYPH